MCMHEYECACTVCTSALPPTPYYNVLIMLGDLTASAALLFHLKSIMQISNRLKWQDLKQWYLSTYTGKSTRQPQSPGSDSMKILHTMQLCVKQPRLEIPQVMVRLDSKYVCVHACMCVCLHACVCVCVCVCVCS